MKLFPRFFHAFFLITLFSTAMTTAAGGHGLPAPTPIEPADESRTIATPTFYWEAVDSATHYQIQIDTSTSFSAPLADQEADGQSMTLTTSLDDGFYQWRIRAIMGAFSGDWSAPRSFEVHTTTYVPPLMLTPTNGLSTLDETPFFTWTPVANAISYELQIWMTDPPATTTNSMTGTSYTPLANLLPGIHFWRVRSRFAPHTLSGWSGAFAFTIESLADAAPYQQFYTTGSPVLTWNPVNNITAYHIQVARKDDFAASSLVHENPNLSSDTPQMTISPALADGVYYWRVRSRSGSDFGQWSEPVRFTVDAP
jgi:hypothetical protein